jgi:hypothetical protein
VKIKVFTNKCTGKKKKECYGEALIGAKWLISAVS